MDWPKYTSQRRATMVFDQHMSDRNATGRSPDPQHQENPSIWDSTRIITSSAPPPMLSRR